MLKARKQGPPGPQLRLIQGEKPGPDTIDRDAEVVDRLLKDGFTFVRYLSIDSVGVERPCESKRFSVMLIRQKGELHIFMKSSLGPAPFSEASEERLASVLMDAEEEGIIRLKVVK